MPGAKLPLYSFPRRYAIKPKRVRSFGDLHAVPDLYENAAAGDGSSDEEQEKSFLDALLLAQVGNDPRSAWVELLKRKLQVLIKWLSDAVGGSYASRAFPI